MQQVSMTRDEALLQSTALIQAGNRKAAKDILLQILKAVPNDGKARDELRSIVYSQETADLQNFTKQFEAKVKEAPEFFIQAAAGGWRYVGALDNAFIDPSLKKIEKKKRVKDTKAKLDKKEIPAALHGPEKLIQSLLDISDIKERWDQVEGLVRQESDALLCDSYADVPDSELQAALRNSVGQDGVLNVVILGAGCVGLAVANALKMALGDKVNILVIDNRVQRRHVKKPYDRIWLTHISSGLLEGIYDPDVCRILMEFGRNGYMGATLDIFETLLMLSNKKLGVKFYYDADYDLSFLEDSKAHFIFDATGGRYAGPLDGDIDISALSISSAPKELTINMPASAKFGESHIVHGITNYPDYPAQTLVLKQEEQGYMPYTGDTQIRCAMFKLTSVPMDLYDSILAYVKRFNADSLFYIWPGNLRPELNKILALINLNKAGYEELARVVPEKMPLAEFLKRGVQNLKHVDHRILKFFQLLEQSGRIENIGIEPPFIYTPYVNMMSDPFPRLYGRPIIPVGDTIFNGHPKVGNGLGSHLQFVQRIHDLALGLYGE